MYGVKLKVWGDYACFTRPEMKVERVTYDVITPSAARGILESIYWKPSIRWVIDKIIVTKPIKTISIKRNEVKKLVEFSKNQEEFFKSLVIEDDEIRVQRMSTVLRDVEYVIYAHLEVLSDEEVAAKGFDISERTDDDRNPAKHIEIFRRRAKAGQCFKQPYLGTREFSAFFELVDDEKPLTVHPELKGERDLQIMLYDIDYSDPKNPQPMFFRARMVDGVIEVPPPDSKEVFR